MKNPACNDKGGGNQLSLGVNSARTRSPTNIGETQQDMQEGGSHHRQEMDLPKVIWQGRETRSLYLYRHLSDPNAEHHAENYG